MSGMFSKPNVMPVVPPPAPRPIRMPNENDPTMIEAAKRTREAAMKRTGRMSTMLTDATQESVGAASQKLGA